MLKIVFFPPLASIVEQALGLGRLWLGFMDLCDLEVSVKETHFDINPLSTEGSMEEGLEGELINTQKELNIYVLLNVLVLNTEPTFSDSLPFQIPPAKQEMSEER